MGLATQLLRIMFFSFFSFLAANGIGVWDPDAGTLTLHVESVAALVDWIGGHLATLGGSVAQIGCGDSSRESSVIAGLHEQTHTADLQDQELAKLQQGA